MSIAFRVRGIAGVIVLTLAVFPSLSATNAVEKARIAKNQAELKLYPDPDSKTLKILSLGMEVEIVEKRGAWIRIALPVDADGFVISGYLRAEELRVPEARPESVPAPLTGSIQKRGVVQLEIHGGMMALNPSDLNLRADYEEKHAEFYNDQYYAYHKAAGRISQFTRSAEGGFARITNALPFGFRLRFNLGRRAALSLGLKYMLKTQTSEKTFFNTAEWTGSSVWFETVQEEVKPLTLRLEGIVPQLGVHYAVIASDVDLEAYLLGGLVFSKGEYSLEWDYIYEDGWNYSHSHKTIDEQGQGTGLSLESGLRVTFHFGGHGGAFIEGGYAYQPVDRLKGPGRSEYTRESNTGSIPPERMDWTGDWIIKQQTCREVWGTMSFQYPSNYGDDISSYILKVRDFRLNLSGFQVRLGFFVVF